MGTARREKNPPPIRNTSFECLLFDLDDTLYPASTGLMSACSHSIHGYLQERLHVDAITAQNLSRVLYKLYGSSLAGLVAIGYKCDFAEYNRCIHRSLPYENLRPDVELRELLLSIPQRKAVFTNGSKEHALQCLERLGVKDCFMQIVSFDNLNLENNFNSSMPIICKPLAKAFERTLQSVGADASKTLFFDDSPKNIEAAKDMGLWTCLVGSSNKPKGADYVVARIHDIKEAIPDIWTSTNIEREPNFDDTKVLVDQINPEIP